jgi:hypothetical protein
MNKYLRAGLLTGFLAAVVPATSVQAQSAPATQKVPDPIETAMKLVKTYNDLLEQAKKTDSLKKLELEKYNPEEPMTRAAAIQIAIEVEKRADVLRLATMNAGADLDPFLNGGPVSLRGAWQYLYNLGDQALCIQTNAHNAAKGVTHPEPMNPEFLICRHPAR